MVVRAGERQTAVFGGRDYRVAVELQGRAVPAPGGRAWSALRWLGRAWFRGLVLHVAAMQPHAAARQPNAAARQPNAERQEEQ